MRGEKGFYAILAEALESFLDRYGAV